MVLETETVVDPNSGKLVKRVKKIMVKFDDIKEVQCIERMLIRVAVYIEVCSHYVIVMP